MQYGEGVFEFSQSEPVPKQSELLQRLNDRKGRLYMLIFTVSNLEFVPTIGSWEFIYLGMLMLAWLPAVYILQIIIHEGGHWFFGLISGYQFISFRIGGVTLVSEEGRLRIKYYLAAGSAGQCLMLPSNSNRFKNHYALYLLGGIMADLILFLCTGILVIGSWKLSIYVRCAALIYSLYSLICIVMNALPKVDGAIMNDGTSFYLLRRDKKTVYFFFGQLEIMGRLQSGTPYRKLPKELIQVSKTIVISNEMIAWNKVFESYYYMDQGDWASALDCILLLEEAIQQGSCSLLLRNTILLEKLFLAIKLSWDEGEILVLYEASKVLMVRRGEDFNVLRVQAAYELYKSHLKETKHMVRKAMNRMRLSYPYKGEATFCCSLIRNMLKEG